MVTYEPETMIPTKDEEENKKILEENYEENLRSKESSRRNLPKTDQLRGPGKIARKEHCESCKDTEFT